MLVKCNDKMFEEVEDGPWTALKPVEVKEAKSICNRWNGHKIKMSQVAPIASFFEWSQAETKSETMIHGYYHEDWGWEFLVLPQKGHSGLSVSLLDDDEGKKAAMTHLPGRWLPGTPWDPSYGKEWVLKSTWHHHCTSAAFQSGGDHADELTKEGFHVTLGNISSSEYSFHARSSYGHQCLDVVLSDWFELDPVVAAAVPEAFHDACIAKLLKQPPKEIVFPEWWKANVHKVVAQPISYLVGHSFAGSSFGERIRSHRTYESFKEDLIETCKMHVYFLDDAKYLVDEINKDPFLTELIDLMVWQDVSVNNALEILNGMLTKTTEQKEEEEFLTSHGWSLE